MPASLADVARVAGVSVATASRVVSGVRYPVSAAARAKVENAVEQLGYTPNALARALVKGRSRVIGAIVGDVTDPYFAEIAKGLEEQAGLGDHLTVVCNADRSIQREAAYIRMLLDDQAAGIVIAGGAFISDPAAKDLVAAIDDARRHDTPVIVLADRGLEGVSVIDVDNRAVLVDATRFLIRLGHRRIAYVPGPEGFSTELLRREGYMLAMANAGLEAIVVDVGGFDHRAGRAAVKRLQSAPLPDAIIGFGEELAVAMLVALRQAGVNVPGDVSVMGIDGTRYSEVLDLTSVKVPTWELGATASRLIIEEENLPDRLVLPHRVISRSTTAPSPGNVP